MAQKAIITDYPDGTRVMSNIRNFKGVPIIGLNSTYTATRVTQWYDGSPMDDTKADGMVYLKHKDSGDYYRVNLGVFGELSLEKDTMAQMRALSATEILLLKMGYYKGVTLNGYYAKGDTPYPINYYLSNTTDTDDGGSVIEVGGIKMEHNFVGNVHTSFFGAKNSKAENSSQQIQKAIDYSIMKRINIIMPNKCMVNTPLILDRLVDGLDSGDYLYIEGGEVYVDGDINLFSSNLGTGEHPSSQLIYWSNIKFIGISDDNYVINGSKFLRIYFNGCSFYNIKLLRSDIYVQSIYVNNSQARKWDGTFIECNAGCYDVHITSSIFEHGENFFKSYGNNDHKAQFWIDQSVIEGLSGYGVKYSQATQVTISNTYFEHNNGSSIESINTSESVFDVNVNILSNFFAGGSSVGNTPEGYRHVIFGAIQRGRLVGNVCGLNNLVYYLSGKMSGVFQDKNWGDVSTNIIGKRSQIYFADSTPTVSNPNPVNSEFFLSKGSVIFNTDIRHDNNWIGAICITDKEPYQTAKFLKFGENTIRDVSLKGDEDLNGYKKTAIIFTENNLVSLHSSFPINQRGCLEVLLDINGNRLNVIQKYTTISFSGNNRVFIRIYYGSGGVWSVWNEVGVMSGSTGNRPTLGLIVGTSYFDSTLKKPIWWDGVNWVDSSGLAI